MIDKNTMISRFLTPLPVLKRPNTEVVRSRLTRVCSDNPDQTFAALRAYDLVFRTTLSSLYLTDLEAIRTEDFDNTNTLEYIVEQMDPVNEYVRPAISELNDILPTQTSAILKEHFTERSPLMRLAVMVFVVSIATLEDLL